MKTAAKRQSYNVFVNHSGNLFKMTKANYKQWLRDTADEKKVEVASYGTNLGAVHNVTSIDSKAAQAVLILIGGSDEYRPKRKYTKRGTRTVDSIRKSVRSRKTPAGETSQQVAAH